MADRKRRLRVLLMHCALLPALLFLLYFFVLAPKEWQGVDEVVVEKIAREHGRTPKAGFLDPGEGDLLLFAFLIAAAVGGFGAGYWWRRLMERRQPASSVSAQGNQNAHGD